VNTWGGQVYFDARRGLVEPRHMGQVKGVLCADREQRLWFAAHGRLQYRHKGRDVTVSNPRIPDFGLGGCMPAKDGGEWLATNAGVFHADRQAGHVVRVLPPVTRQRTISPISPGKAMTVTSGRPGAIACATTA